MKKVFLACLIAFIAVQGIKAQTKALKVGHINSTELVAAMPETKKADQKLKETEDQLTNFLQTLYKEYEAMLVDYKSADTLPEMFRKHKEEMILEKQKKLSEYDQTIPVKLQEKRVELYTPIYEMARKAIKEVATENGFTYILDSSQGYGVIFSENGIDIMDKVKKKLNITDSQ